MTSGIIRDVKSPSMTIKTHDGMKRVIEEQHIWLDEESVNTIVILLAFGRIPVKVDWATSKALVCQ